MTADPIPAEAVEAAARAWYKRSPHILSWMQLTDDERYGWREMVRPIVTAAAPYIAAQATNDLRAGIEALRDEMPVLTTELCGHEPDEHPEGCCDVCDLAFAIDSEVRDRLDALLRGAK